MNKQRTICYQTVYDQNYEIVLILAEFFDLQSDIRSV